MLRRTWIPLAAIALVLVSTGLLGFAVSVPVVSVLAMVAFWFVVLLAGFWFAFRAYQRLLWRVSGRLAFSYFLIGVVPIPLVGALLLLVGWTLAGFFLGHLFRTEVTSVVRQTVAAAAHGESRDSGNGVLFAVAHYAGGLRVAGDERAPASWPGWLAEETADSGGNRPIFVNLPDGSFTLAAAVGAERSGSGSVAFLTQDLDVLLRERSGFWIAPLLNTNGRDESRISVGGTSVKLRTEPVTKEEAKELAEQRHQYFVDRSKGSRLLDWPGLRWIEQSTAVRDFATGESEAGSETAFVLAATPRMAWRPLATSDAEFSQALWVAFLTISILLFCLYAVAELIAFTLIFGLSRAVTRLYRATTQIAQGDFSARIPVRRTDQVGALQLAFNSMAANLQDLVATAAQKELLDKELEIAREVQKSLLPQGALPGEGIDLATLFEPSAAIGGDYFDLLRWGPDHLAVVIADVSGHGLSTGLRMAMVKAALQILVDELDDPTEILGRLDTVVRGEGGDRFFVTATLGRLDFRQGRLELANAGHPPTYRLSGGEVQEIVLPGSPLGALRRNYGHTSIEIADGDVLVWLSDGLIEACDPTGEPFGYPRVVKALEGPVLSAAQVRDRLLAAVAAHTRGVAADDDRTLVVLRYLGG